jgi:hypothetical protein
MLTPEDIAAWQCIVDVGRKPSLKWKRETKPDEYKQRLTLLGFAVEYTPTLDCALHDPRYPGREFAFKSSPEAVQVAVEQLFYRTVLPLLHHRATRFFEGRHMSGVEIKADDACGAARQITDKYYGRGDIPITPVLELPTRFFFHSDREGGTFERIDTRKEEE